MRAKVFFYVCAAMACFLAWRLYTVQVVQGPSLARQALAQRSDTVEVFARRGSITDRDGNVLVRSLPSESVYAVPHDIVDVDATVAKLQHMFGKLSPPTTVALHDKKLWFVWIARKIPSDVAEGVRALDLPGVQLQQEDTGKRVDMAGRMASTLLGFVGTDENGLDGIEYSFDSILKGESGRVTLEADEFGRPIPFGQQSTIKPAQPGLNVELTLDSYLQYVTEEALAEQVTKYHALDGTAIVMDPWTGEILAMANLPHFDPNKFWKYKENDRRDRAVTDAYEPGSTYKLVTAAAALESGKVTTRSLFPARRYARGRWSRDSQRRRRHAGGRRHRKPSSRSFSTRTTSARPRSASRSVRVRSMIWSATPDSARRATSNFPAKIRASFRSPKSGAIRRLRRWRSAKASP